jgi:O-acetyl-ADP-ribose deacetylase (regulator of RNase III)
MHTFKIPDSTILSMVEGDITDQDVEAIVNAANSSLMGGGGVDGAIHRRGGSKILQECVEIRKSAWKDGLAQGMAVITSGGDLKARFVIHTVGPVWGGSREDHVVLESCYLNSLILAEQNSLSSIAFPAISTGAYGYPMREASQVAIRSIASYFEHKKSSTLKDVRIVLFTRNDLDIHLETARAMLQSIVLS